MACYFRHIKKILVQAGLEVAPRNKKTIDRALRELVGVPHKPCSAVWKAIKEEYFVREGGCETLMTKLKSITRPP